MNDFILKKRLLLHIATTSLQLQGLDFYFILKRRLLLHIAKTSFELQGLGISFRLSQSLSFTQFTLTDPSLGSIASYLTHQLLLLAFKAHVPSYSDFIKRSKIHFILKDHVHRHVLAWEFMTTAPTCENLKGRNEAGLRK